MNGPVREAPKKIGRLRKSNKLTGRERLALLLDEDSPFMEIGALVGWDHDDSEDGNSMIAGIGIVSGVECVVTVNIPSVGRGAMNKLTGMKWNRASTISMENGLPFIQLLENSGADLNNTFELFHAKPNCFSVMAQRSKKRIPTVTCVFGTCVAGGAYMAGMSDYNIMVKGNAHLALAGSRLVKVATGEVSTEEEIGGAEMHSKISGVSDYLAKDEYEAIRRAREVIGTLTHLKQTHFPVSIGEEEVEEPFYDPDELLGIVSTDFRKGFDIKEVIARVADGSCFAEFKPLYGSTMVCCWAKLYGIPVGFVANNGVIFSESSQKAAHFVNLCNQRGYPLIFLHNVTGFMVGKKYEESGIIKWGSQMVNAVSNSVVPKFTIIVGGSFGAGNFAMNGTGYDPRFIFSWPNSQCGIMGSDQISGVLELLAVENAQKRGKQVNRQKVDALKAMAKSRHEEELNVFHSSSRFVDDGVIDPRDTRTVLGFCLSAVCNVEIKSDFISGLARL